VRRTLQIDQIFHFKLQLILSLCIRLSERREGKRERQVMPSLLLSIKFALILVTFQTSFSQPVGRQLATFARILVPKYFFHLPWRPKWWQLRALYINVLVMAVLGFPYIFLFNSYKFCILQLDERYSLPVLGSILGE